MHDSQTLTDEERQLLVTLVTDAWDRFRAEAVVSPKPQQCEAILRKISGDDKVIVVTERPEPFIDT
jgi:hypothetical protein